MKPTETPIPYTIRLSARAKRLQMKVSAQGKVEVVLPKGVNAKVVEPFVKKHQQWLTETLQRLKTQQTTKSELSFPDTIHLKAIKQSFNIAYYYINNKNDLLKRTAPETVKIFSDHNSHKKKALQQWLNMTAKETLIPWLHQTSETLNLPFNKATIRAQKTRWGSCSSRKNISINRNLLFLPKSVVQYLFIHELCHTKHLNHSKAYWAFVEKMEPNYKALDRALHHANRQVPHWALP
ncbi:MAG: M48 family metallopeptidase [Gammaproteobacteria bacterium]|nr:M48 family metallopeptidase [Gammaproteobacteria bacterium]